MYTLGNAPSENPGQQFPHSLSVDTSYQTSHLICNMEKPERSFPKFRTDHILLGFLPSKPQGAKLPIKRCGQGGKTTEYGRERAANSQPQIYRYWMGFTGNYGHSLHNIKRLVFVMVKQKLHLCLFLYNI